MREKRGQVPSFSRTTLLVLLLLVCARSPKPATRRRDTTTRTSDTPPRHHHFRWRRGSRRGSARRGSRARRGSPDAPPAPPCLDDGGSLTPLLPLVVVDAAFLSSCSRSRGFSSIIWVRGTRQVGGRFLLGRVHSLLLAPPSMICIDNVILDALNDSVLVLLYIEVVTVIKYPVCLLSFTRLSCGHSSPGTEGGRARYSILQNNHRDASPGHLRTQQLD